MIAGRAIQGLASGGLLVLDNTIIANLFSLWFVYAVTSPMRLLLRVSQRARQVLWNGRQHMSHRLFLGTRSRWCFHCKNFLAMVVLHQLYVALAEDLFNLPC
jgi:hypothetical protein